MSPPGQRLQVSTTRILPAQEDISLGPAPPPQPADEKSRLDPPTVGEALTPGQQKATKKLDKAIAKDRGKVEDALQRIGGCARVHEDEILTVKLSDECLAEADEEVQEAVGVDVLSNGMAP